MASGLDYPDRWTPDRQHPDSTHLVHMLIDAELFQRVQDAAAAHGASVAAWLRLAMRHITLEDFPASWRVGETSPRSHESGHYQRRFMLRLDDETSHKLETLTCAFDRPAAEVIRQLIGQAKPEDFPRSWQVAIDDPQESQGHPVNSSTKRRVPS
jgi:hypothetical protein